VDQELCISMVTGLPTISSEYTPNSLPLQMLCYEIKSRRTH